MNAIVQVKENLKKLIRGEFKEGCTSNWGMQEYDTYYEKYLSTLSESEQVAVFKQAYKELTSQEIDTLFWLASSFGVPFKLEYFNILREETEDEKRQAAFAEIYYYVTECWTEKGKSELTADERSLLDQYAKKYGMGG